MNQAELRQLATERILDADALIAAQRSSFAYYVAGYAVECALKSAVLARMVVTGGVFKDKKFAADCWRHDFGELIKVAGLEVELNNQFAADAAFVANWAIVTQWRETVRYEPRTEQEARELYRAITVNPHGVLPWINTYW